MGSKLGSGPGPDKLHELHFVTIRDLQAARSILDTNIATLRRLDKAYKYFASMESSINEPSLSSVPSSNIDFSPLISELRDHLHRVIRLLSVTDDVTTMVQTRIRLRSTDLSLDTMKLDYLSQNTLKGTAWLAALFLPGIFVSVGA